MLQALLTSFSHERTTMKNTLKMAALIAIVSLSANVARATTSLIYNCVGALDQSGSYEISSSYAGGPLAAEFLSGNAPSTISYMEIFLYAPAATSSGTINVSLLSNSNGPGTLLSTIGSISGVAATPSASYPTQVFASSYQLAANTEYWIELSSTDTEWNWEYSNQPIAGGVGVAGQDTYWNGNVIYNQAWAYDMENFTTTVDATSASPEPATLALCGFSCLCLAARLRRRRPTAR